MNATKMQPLVVRNGNGETLNPLGTTLKFICPGDATERAWSLAEVSVPFDAGPPPHEHPWDEAYFILEGEIRFTVGSETVLARTGDFVYVPGNLAHGFKGNCDTPARALIFDAPAASEHFFRDLHKEVRHFPDDLHKVPAIGERHNLRFLR